MYPPFGCSLGGVWILVGMSSLFPQPPPPATRTNTTRTDPRMRLMGFPPGASGFFVHQPGEPAPGLLVEGAGVRHLAIPPAGELLQQVPVGRAEVRGIPQGLAAAQQADGAVGEAELHPG